MSEFPKIPDEEAHLGIYRGAGNVTVGLYTYCTWSVTPINV